MDQMYNDQRVNGNKRVVEENKGGSGSFAGGSSQNQNQAQPRAPVPANASASQNQVKNAGNVENGAKKENPPSRVVHLRNLPLPNNNNHPNYPQHEDLEGEVIKMGFDFGPIKDLLMMRKSGQAFLEMETLEDAIKFVDQYREDPPNIGRHTVYIQYSKHQELSNVDNNHQQQQLRERLKEARNGKLQIRSNGYNNFQNGAAAGANANRTQNRSMNGGNGAQQFNGNANNAGGGAKRDQAQQPNNAGIANNHQGAGDFSGRNQSQANAAPNNNEKRVLHVVIEKEKFPVTIHQFRDLFERHGTVQRIVMFKKTNDNRNGGRCSQQVLIEMKDAVAAQSAQSDFNGANIYDGSNIMRIDFSNLSELQVKADTDQRWDYTRSPKPNDNMNLQNYNMPQNHPMGAGDNRRNMGANANMGNPAGYPQANFQNNPNFQNLGYGYPVANNMGFNNGQPMPNYGMAPPMNMNYGDRNSGMNDPSRVNPNAGMQMSNSASHPGQQAGPGFHGSSYGEQNLSPVLCVSNLPHGQPDISDITPYDLFILFGVYGDVHRVKILYEKRDSALIEFATPPQAGTALKYLNNMKLRGREMKLKLSKYQKVNLPKDKSQDTHNLTEDYSNHHLHRFRKQGSKNYQNIYQPSDVLHLSNIPEGTVESVITDLFCPHGKVVQFKFFKDPKMALIKMGSIEEAIACLIKTHNHKMSPNQHLRVSFSRGYLTP